MHFGMDPFAFHVQDSKRQSETEGGAFIQTVSPSVQQSKQVGSGGRNTTMSWGSDVEMPQPGEKVTPPKTPRTNVAPIINIQAPTESNMGKSQFGATASQAGTSRTPKSGPTREVDGIDEHMVDLPDAAMPNPTERDLPPRPTESIQSFHPAPSTHATTVHPPQSSAMGRSNARSQSNMLPQSGQPDMMPQFGMPPQSGMAPPSGMMPQYAMPPQTGMMPQSHPMVPSMAQSPPLPQSSTLPQTFVTAPSKPPTVRQGETMQSLKEALNSTPTYTNPAFPSDSHTQTAYKTAAQTIEPNTPPQVLKDRIHLMEHQTPPSEDLKPWDLVAQRLYSWALIWEEGTFNKAMEDLSLGKQVEEFALTIFVMMTFRR